MLTLQASASLHSWHELSSQHENKRGDFAVLDIYLVDCTLEKTVLPDNLGLAAGIAIAHNGPVDAAVLDSVGDFLDHKDSLVVDAGRGYKVADSDSDYLEWYLRWIG
jgi:hypothetical protein